jgi:hypothetical protein
MSRNFKNPLLFSFAFFACFAVTSLAADTVVPASLSFTNKREEATQQVTWGDNLWWSGSLNLTNCMLYSNSAGTTTQGLDGVTVTVVAGNSTTNISYTATVQSAADGTWHCTVTNLSVSQMQFQVTITDGSGNSYIYGIKQKACSEPL